MHPCLQVTELLLAIFREINPEKTDSFHYADQPTLARLARTCTVFTVPALDILWECMTSLCPLIHLLPQHTISLRRVKFLTQDRHVLGFNSDSLGPQDLDLFRSYASKIREMCLTGPSLNSDYRKYGVDTAFYGALVKATTFYSRPLLPNVRRFVLSPSLLLTFGAVPLLFSGPNLKDIHFIQLSAESPTYRRWTEFVKNLHELIDANNELSSLSLPMVNEFARTECVPEATSFLLNMPPPFFSLKKLDLQAVAIKGRSVACLGRVVGLEKLTMNILDEGPDCIDLRQAEGPGGFQALKEFKILSSRVDAISRMVEQWGAKNLESFTVQRFTRKFYWDIGLLMRGLARLPHDTLTYLVVENVPGGAAATDPYNDNTSDLTFEALKNMFLFSQLVRLSVNLGGSALLNDSQLLKAVKYFPKLKTLEFEQREHCKLPSPVTPLGLYKLVASLPNLRKLMIRFDGTSNFPEEEKVTPQKLTELHICESDAVDAATLSRFLKSCFPDLKNMSFGFLYDGYTGREYNLEYEDPETEAAAFACNRCWNEAWSEYLSWQRSRCT